MLLLEFLRISPKEDILLTVNVKVNILVPLQLGILVDALGYGRIPYKELILYVVYRGLQGQQGAIGSARSVLWIPVSQSLFRRLSCAAFEHVLGLSMDFHLSKRIGEVTSALSRGSAINTFLENFLFQVSIAESFIPPSLPFDGFREQELPNRDSFDQLAPANSRNMREFLPCIY
jgi:ABC-type transport system involved in Fe-S cluster assembly fused permease/ATPase subunit